MSADPIADAIAEDERHRECVSALDCHLADGGRMIVSDVEYECSRVQIRRPILAALIAGQERTREWALALQSLTYGGSEYVNDPQRCVTDIRARREFQHSSIIKAVRRQRVTQTQLATARAGLEEIERTPTAYCEHDRAARGVLVAISQKDDNDGEP